MRLKRHGYDASRAKEQKFNHMANQILKLVEGSIGAMPNIARGYLLEQERPEYLHPVDQDDSFPWKKTSVGAGAVSNSSSTSASSTIFTSVSNLHHHQSYHYPVVNSQGQHSSFHAGI
ncbi:hypothetical protein BGX24_008386 [Mortierella sp. AD032]|nr:hypothetical protein BGX24_008386 [Mortierella sp. AD032]